MPPFFTSGAIRRMPMRGRLIFIILVVVLFPACSKNVSVCMDLGANANVHGDFGYFYDSATVDLTGPAKFRRLATDLTADPCTNIEAAMTTP